MEMECVLSQELPKEAAEMEVDVTEPIAAIESLADNANEEENNINTNEVDMLQEHVYSNDDGSVELAPQINVDENTILLPVAGENGLNADDPAISFNASDFLQEEEQVLDPMMGTNVTVDPVISDRPKRTPSQVPKKRRDAVMVKYESEDISPEKVKKRRGRKKGCKVVNGQVIYQYDENAFTPAKSTPKAKSVFKSAPKAAKKEDGSVNDSQCRVCRSDEDLINAFKKEYTKTYAEKLMAICPSVSIQRKDFLPQFICRICVSSVNAAYALKTQCERTDAELRERLEKSIKKVRRPVAKGYLSPESDPDEFPDPSMDQDFKLSDATPPSADDDSDSDYGKPLAKRRTRRRSRKVSKMGSTSKAVNSEKNPISKSLSKKSKLTSPTKEIKSSESMKEKKSSPSMKEAKSTPPTKENKLTPSPKKAIKPDPDLNTSMSPEPDLDATGFTTGSEDDYSPPKKRRQKSATKGATPRDALTCRICKETMTSKDELKQHKKVMHSDHECELCGRRFRMLGSLKSHMEKHTKSSDLKCGQCEKHFANKTERRKHMIDVHKESPAQYICEKCKRAFTSELRLLKHNESRCPGFETHAKKNKGELESMAMGKDLFKCVAPLTTTYWSDSFSD